MLRCVLDRVAQVRKLESQGVPTKHAEAITSAITEVLNDSLESISESFVTNAEMQKVITPIYLSPSGSVFFFLFFWLGIDIRFLLLLLPFAVRDAAGGQYLQVQVASAELAGILLAPTKPLLARSMCHWMIADTFPAPLIGPFC
jgi:hypothetical protein